MVYALLGNNQARDPWLDESFATYAQARAAGQLDIYKHSDVDSDVRAKLGQPMTYWAGRGGFDRYVRGVYDQGAAALIEGQRRGRSGRIRPGDARTSTPMQTRWSNPPNAEKAFKDAPVVVDLLREAGRVGVHPERGRQAPRRGTRIGPSL